MDLSLLQAPQKAQWPEIVIRIISFLYVMVMILVPLVVIFQDGFQQGFSEFWHQITLPIARHAIFLTLWTSALMTVINAVMGVITAYVFVRFEFPGKRLMNAIVDLPLAIPTLVTGVMLVMLYGPQETLGRFLSENIGLNIIFASPGIVISLLFISFPFVVRAIQPVLQDIDLEQERAAATLGAKPWTIFRRIVLPALIVPVLSGSLLSFSRAVGEFGAVVIVAGNIPLKTQTAAVYVLGAVESENQLGASAISIILIAISLFVLTVADTIHKYWGAHR